MSYAPTRARSRAPWIALLLTPLLALASVLVPVTAASAAPGDVTDATLQWGFKQSFRNYLVGPIAHGQVIGTGVDTTTPYGWSGGSGAVSGGTGTVAYPGTLQFQGHKGTGVPADEYALDITISDVRVSVTSATAGMLQADVVSRDMNTGVFATYADVPLATLDLGAGSVASTATTLAYTGVPATLTAEGSPAFALYPAGTALDPVSFSWPVEQPAAVPTLTTTVTAVSQADGFSVDISATDFADITASYVSIVEKGTDTAFIGAAEQVAVVDGAFTQALSAPTASLDRTKQYDVIAWKTRSNPSAATIYARTTIAFTAEQWKTIFPPVPTLATSVTAATVDGLTIEVAASDFDDITASYVSIVEKGTDTAFIGAAEQVAVVDGAFTQALTAPAASLDAATQYDVIAWKTRSNPSAATIYARSTITITSEQWDAVFPPATPTLTPSITSADATDGLVITVNAAGFDDIAATYLSIVEKGTDTAFIGAPAQVTSIVDGAFTQALTAPVASLDASKQYDVIAWKTRSNPSAATIYARSTIAVTTGQWNAIFPPAPETPALTAGSLSWGVKASFRSYVTGPIAHGAITTSGVSTVLGNFVFPQAGDAQLTSGLGSVAYSGSVRFTGHDGVLDLRLSDPQVRIDSATSGTLLVRVNGGTRVAFANLALASGTKTTDATGAVRYANVPATITAAGAGAFSLEGSTFYPAGTALDPVTFVAGSASGSSAGTVVVASASARTANTPDATPPATVGITITDGEPVEGGELTAEAGGFQPNETGILAVIYSEPTVLAENLTADATGRVVWTGALPRGLTGTHTLTFQGSVDRGIVLDIAAASELQCTVSDASLVWGFKESFRAYIDGSIANGEWTTEGDVSYATPLFTWTGGTGGADADGALDAQFSGAVRFTGHGGVLDTTIANPRVVIDGDRAVLMLDIHGTTQAGDAVEQSGVEFAELDLAGATRTQDGDELTLADVPAVLTAAGASAFGTYPEGEALDALTITATVESGCATEVEQPSAAPRADELDTEQAGDEGWPVWATALIIALLVAAIVAAAVVILVRRRRA